AAASITDQHARAWVVARVTRALTRSSRHQQAYAASSSIADRDAQAEDPAQSAQALADPDRDHRAEAAAQQAETAARSKSDPYAKTWAWAKATQALVKVGHYDQAVVA